LGYGGTGNPADAVAGTFDYGENIRFPEATDDPWPPTPDPEAADPSVQVPDIVSGAPAGKIRNLIEDFSSLAAWITTLTPTLSGGAVQLGSNGTSGDGIVSAVQNWDLTSSEIAFQCTQMAAGYRETFAGVTPAGGNPFQTADVGFFCTGDSAVCNIHVNGADSGTSFTFTVASTPWLFLREAGGTLFFETAATYAGTRTSRYSMASPGWINSVQAMIQVYFSDAIDPVSSWDNINNAALPAVDSTPPTPNLTTGSARMSAQTGKDTFPYSFTVDEACQAYQIRVVNSSADPFPSGNIVEAGGAIAAGGTASGSISYTELVAAALANEGGMVVKVFVQDSAGNWSV
jgi:hypothetical protein